MSDKVDIEQVREAKHNPTVRVDLVAEAIAKKLFGIENLRALDGTPQEWLRVSKARRRYINNAVKAEHFTRIYDCYTTWNRRLLVKAVSDLINYVQVLENKRIQEPDCEDFFANLAEVLELGEGEDLTFESALDVIKNKLDTMREWVDVLRDIYEGLEYNNVVTRECRNKTREALAKLDELEGK